MTLPKISFVKGQGGLGRTLPGEDYISGFIFYNASTPSGFATNKIQKVLSTTDAKNLGITNDNSDATSASATLTFSSGFTSSFAIYVKDYTSTGFQTTNVYLGTFSPYNIPVDDATACAQMINAYGFNKWTATSSGATVTLYAPKSYGEYPNGDSVEIEFAYYADNTLITKTEFTGGVGSKFGYYYYQIEEFFRLQPNGVLYISWNSIPTTYFATEILSIQQYAEGKIRQLAVLVDAKNSITTADVLALNNAIVATEDTFGVSFSALYSVNLTQSLSTLPNLGSITANKVSVVIGQGLSGKALALTNATGKSVPALGTALGTLALSNVAEDIAWVGKYNLSNGTELETAGFQTYENVKNVSIQLLEQLNGFRYVYLRKFIGVAGTFFNDSNCAVGVDSDYAYIENNRTIDKAIRQVKTALFPELNSPITLNANGTLADTTLAHLKGLCNGTLENMVRNNELSAYEVGISDSQDVLSTSTINIVITLIPKGVARQIVVNIGFSTKL